MMELLLFHRWVYNLVVRTLVCNSKWFTLDLNKTQNKVFVANIPGYEFNYSYSLTTLNVLFLYFRTSDNEISIDTHVIYKTRRGFLISFKIDDFYGSIV